MAANGRVYILDSGKQPHKEEAGNCVGVRDIRDFVYLTYALRLLSGRQLEVIRSFQSGR